MFVVDFVRLANGHEVGVFGPLEPRETPVDEDVMHQEVGQTIEGNARTNPEPEVSCEASRNEAVGAGDGENEEESVVFFEESACQAKIRNHRVS